MLTELGPWKNTFAIKSAIKIFSIVVRSKSALRMFWANKMILYHFIQFYNVKSEENPKLGEFPKQEKSHYLIWPFRRSSTLRLIIHLLIRRLLRWQLCDIHGH